MIILIDKVNDRQRGGIRAQDKREGRMNAVRVRSDQRDSAKSCYITWWSIRGATK